MLWSRISFSSASSQSSARCLYQSVASSSSISDVIAWCMASVSLLSRSRGACNPSLDIQSSFEVKNGGAANIPHTPQSPTVGKRKRSDNLREMTRRQRRGLRVPLVTLSSPDPCSVTIAVPGTRKSAGSLRLAATVVLTHWVRRSSIRSEEHTSELQSLMRISYAVFCLKQKKLTQVQKQKTY